MVTEKTDMTRKADTKILNHILYSKICHIENVVIKTQLMLAVMDALNKLEDETLHKP